MADSLRQKLVPNDIYLNFAPSDNRFWCLVRGSLELLGYVEELGNGKWDVMFSPYHPKVEVKGKLQDALQKMINARKESKILLRMRRPEGS